jgi:hypothetical protein
MTNEVEKISQEVTLLKEQQEMLSQLLSKLCVVVKNIITVLSATTELQLELEKEKLCLIEKEKLCLKQKIKK